MQMAGRGGESLLQELYAAVHTRGGRRLLKDGLLMSEQALRWLLILETLELRGAPMTSTELHGWLLREHSQYMSEKTQLRTVQRDLESIEGTGLFGLKVLDPDTKPLQWYVDPKEKQLAGMRVETAAALKLILAHVNKLLPDDLLGSLRKQEQRADAVLARARINMPHSRPLNERIRTAPIGHVLQPPTLQPGLLDCIFTAMRTDAKVHAAYLKQNAEAPTERSFSVLGLVLRPPKYEVVACNGDRIYTMLLHRMSNARLLDEQAEWPRDFSLDDWLAQGRSDVLVQENRPVVIEVNPGLARAWSETPLAPEQTIESSECGSFCRITVHLPITEAFRGYLLSFGWQVRIIEPEWLRDWARDQAQGIVEGRVERPAPWPSSAS